METTKAAVTSVPRQNDQPSDSVAYNNESDENAAISASVIVSGVALRLFHVASGCR